MGLMRLDGLLATCLMFTGSLLEIHPSSAFYYFSLGTIRFWGLLESAQFGDFQLGSRTMQLGTIFDVMGTIFDVMGTIPLWDLKLYSGGSI